MSSEKDIIPNPEFSHVVDVSKVPKTGIRVRMEADHQVCQRLAKRYNINNVQALIAKLQVKPWRKGGLHVTGVFEAGVVQNCIVSLEPISEQISEEVSVYLLPSDLDDDVEKEFLLNPQNQDELDVLTSDEFDLGEMIAEQLAVALDPYPRKPGSELSAILPDGFSSTDKKAQNPFEVLKSMNIETGKYDKN